MVRTSEGEAASRTRRIDLKLAIVGHAVVERDRAPVVGVLVIDVQLHERNDLERNHSPMQELLVARGGPLDQLLLLLLLVDRQQHLDLREDDVEVLVRDQRLLIGDLSKSTS